MVPLKNLFRNTDRYEYILIMFLLIWGLWIFRSASWLITEMSNPAMNIKRIIIGCSIAIISVAGGAFILFLSKKVCNTWVLPIIIFSIAFLIRLGYIILIPTRPQSDFLVYHTMALQFSGGDFHSFYARPMGYPLLLSMLYRLYPAPVMGRILNVIFSTFTVVLVYQIGRAVENKSLGLTAAFLLAVYPADIMMTSVLATEPAATFFLTFALFGLIQVLSQPRLSLTISLMGLMLAFAVIFRTAFLIYPIGFALAIGWFERQNKKMMFYKLSAFMLSFLIVIFIFLVICAHLVGSFSLKPLSSNVSYFPFLSGTGEIVNVTFAKDSKMYFSWPEKERERLAIKTAFNRIYLNPLRFMKIAGKKIDIMFSSDGYAPMWSFYTVKTRFTKIQQTTLWLSFRIWAQLMKLIMLILGILGLVYLWQTKRRLFWILVFLVILTGLPHIILEAQGRYRHQLNPEMAILAAGGVQMLWCRFGG